MASQSEKVMELPFVLSVKAENSVCSDKKQSPAELLSRV